MLGGGEEEGLRGLHGGVGDWVVYFMGEEGWVCKLRGYVQFCILN